MSRSPVCLLASAIIIGVGVLVIAADTPQAEWKAVDEAIDQGRPKTAIERLQPIVDRAMTEKKYAEAIKAIGLRIALEGNIQGNRSEEKITRMQAEIEKAPAEMKPAMNALLANWFWHYFQQNRWRFMQRSQTAVRPSDDFTTWDLNQILAAIDAQFQRTLEDAESLQKVPIAEYDLLLEKGTAPDSYRPTLYDVLAHNALQFYSAGEQAGSRAEDAFDLSADSPVFSSANDFLTWEPDTTDEASLKRRAIALFQALMLFHQDDDDPSAFLDCDLLRLNFGNNQAFGEEKSARYKAALQRFADKHTSHVISSRALHHLATEIHAEGDLLEARRIALEGMNRFPESVGGRRCFNLIQQIEARSSQIIAERVWNDPRPTIDVRYRNVTKIYFRLVRFDFDDYTRSDRWRPEELDENRRRAILRQRPARSWSADLPSTDDFQERMEQVPTPDDLAKGAYFLIASHNEGFNDIDNQVSFTEVWRSDLAIVTRNHQGRGLIDGFVLSAEKGDPVSDVTVNVWRRSNGQRLVPLPSVKTDRNGTFRVRSTDHRQLLLLATHKDDSLSSISYLNPYRRNRSDPSEQTILFTDRSLYRPGQTIRFKGVCVSVNQEQDDYKTVPRRNVTVVFRDVNGKEIERLEHRTNDFGSFSGSVTAPRDRLPGRMSLMVPEGPRGSVAIRVEEYKRPKFQVELSPPEKAAKLDGVVELTGRAKAFTGAAIDGGKVSWRVVRQVRYPTWWHWRCWWIPPQPGRSQEIAHATVTTAADGSFAIEFTAAPDRSVLQESEPTFQYTVYADVTDTTGETRSAQLTVNVGYTALSASMSVANSDWLTDEDDVAINISTSTLDGEGQMAAGTVKIHTVIQPEEVKRAPLPGAVYRSQRENNPEPDPTNPNSWPLGELIVEQNFATNAGGGTTIAAKLDPGMYRARLETKDRFGKAVTAELPLRVLDPDANRLALKLANLFATPTPSIEPGQEYRALWGSGYDTARAFIEVEHRGKLLQSYWTDPDTTQTAIQQRVDEAMRGGFTIRTTMVRENRAYMQSRQVNVPWSNKQLKLSWEHIVSKLEPAAKETWTAIISAPEIEGSEIASTRQLLTEMVATMYDASLDVYQPHQWQDSFAVFRWDYSNVRSMFENQAKRTEHIYDSWRVARRDASLSYRRFPSRIIQAFQGYEYMRRSNRGGGLAVPMSAVEGFAMDAVDAPATMIAEEMDSAAEMAPAEQMTKGDGQGANGNGRASIDLSKVSTRTNLNETAFFFPHLMADEDGKVKLEFTMPEALTEWKFIGFAHDQQLRAGLLTGTTVTSKELMVQPNPPRFVREGDVVEFSVKVSNQSPTHQTGTVRLSFRDARSNDSVDEKIGNQDRDQEFDIAAGESMTLAWRLTIPDELGFLTYKAVASTGRLSDGEEGFLPVLSRRILVTESLPLPIRGKKEKQFEFTKLLESGRSDSLQHQSLTLQMVSNPSWYAVMSLPYLMEYPHQCTEQTFNRLYANSLARHIAASDPKVRHVFEQWRGTPVLDSPMLKNEEIKAVLIEETPWYQQAQSESQARRNVGILFDENRLNEESSRALHQLTQAQLPDGAWPWFPGGRASDYITLYITTGFGRMRHLGIAIDSAVAIKSLRRLDGWAAERYRRIPRDKRHLNQLSPTIALYLYGRSFFLDDQAVAAEHKEAVDYWLSQAKMHWIQLANRQSQAHLAIALHRFGARPPARGIMQSIKERSVVDDEMGRYWRDLELSWWWYRAPIETQAMMIEAFDEVMDDQQAVEDCKVWLLKQKQTQDWKTTKATADAVYALLLRGSNLLASNALVKVSMGSQEIKPESVESGTGFYEQRFVGGEINPELGSVSVEKTDDGVAWGSVHWQYLEYMDKITPHEGTPLKLSKQLFVKRPSKKGPTLERVDGPIDVGDELVVRLVLKTDRDMEFVHLKDYRGSGTEPVNVLSHYKYQDGLGYYESTRDTASHFFIDYLPKGTYVFEYATRVQLRGRYQTGIASIQCMYAPEFNGHSESLLIEAK